MIKRIVIWCSLVLPILAAPAISSARPPKEEREIGDARLEGYPDGKNVTTETSTGLTWVLLIFLGAVGVGVMFKSAKRTHLD
jgi:hypothetical protein